jgi:hypothetical protein
MESDLQTLFKISEVSKYWNYLSKIDLVRDTVYKKEYAIITHILIRLTTLFCRGSFRVTKEEFERDQQLPSANFLRYEDVRWLQYDRVRLSYLNTTIIIRLKEKYPPEWLVQDHISRLN